MLSRCISPATCWTSPATTGTPSNGRYYVAMGPTQLMLTVAVLLLPTLTALGAQRRGRALPSAVIAGLFFPIT